MKLVLPKLSNFDENDEKKIEKVFKRCAVKISKDRIELTLNEKCHPKRKKQWIKAILHFYNDYFYSNWESNKVIVCLEIMGNYLYHTRKKVDKYAISKKKMKQMIKGNKFYVNFSNLSNESKFLLGLVDTDEE